MKEEICKLILNKSKDLNIELDEEQQEQFYKYMNLIIEWNEKINLTAIIEPKEIAIKHFQDSLTIMQYINDNSSIVDVGTGAGFPGIPLKIANKTLNITLLDSLNKRINFLNEVIEELELKKINAIHSRAEEFAKNKKYRESFDIATSRAVANLSVLAEYMLPMVKVGGMCICMKGPEIDEEIETSKKAIKVLGGKIKKVNKFNLPETDLKRSIVIIEKIEKTPKQYPRKAGTPSKNPIN
jgi:16S rRNA (guanine527-N7)-methyltransferase